MLATKLVCPHCGKNLRTSRPLTAGHRVLCSRCGQSFAVPAEAANGGTAVPPPIPPPAAEAIRPAPPAPRPDGAHVQTVADVAPVAPVARGAQVLWIGVVLGGLLLVLLTSVGLLLAFATRKPAPDTAAQASASAPSETRNNDNSPPPSDELLPAKPDGGEPPAAPRQNSPAPPPPPGREAPSEPPPLADPPELPTNAETEPQRGAWLPPDQQKQVNQAIDRGVKWLKDHQTPEGNWGPRGFHPAGLSALPALTLLECGVPGDDPRVQKALRLVRRSAATLNQTYELALAILFLDRLGDPADEKLIQTFAVRLVAGQTATGGWSYTCPLLKPEQEKDLLFVMRQNRPRGALDLFVGGPGGSAPPGFITKEMSGSQIDKGLQGESTEDKLLPQPGAVPPLDGSGPPDPAAVRKALNRLPPDLRRLPALLPPKESHRMPASENGRTDNSNTQFAILGLSAAHRHNLPLDRSLALIVQRFRTSQAADGHWNYHYARQGAGGTPAMTGAGLLGLAVGLGLAADHLKPQARPHDVRDPAIEKGFRHLAESIGQPLGAQRRGRAPRGRVGINLYFLWTVERCGVLFNRRQIDGKDWYPWGVELLLDAQLADGSWMSGGYPGSMPIVDTCFALLFLKRANLAKDLTKKLEFFMDGKKLSGP